MHGHKSANLTRIQRWALRVKFARPVNSRACNPVANFMSAGLIKVALYDPTRMYMLMNDVFSKKRREGERERDKEKEIKTEKEHVFRAVHS